MCSSQKDRDVGCTWCFANIYRLPSLTGATVSRMPSHQSSVATGKCWRMTHDAQQSEHFWSCTWATSRASFRSALSNISDATVVWLQLCSEEGRHVQGRKARCLAFNVAQQELFQCSTARALSVWHSKQRPCQGQTATAAQTKHRVHNVQRRDMIRNQQL